MNTNPIDDNNAENLTVYTVEIYEVFTNKTRGFYPITVDEEEELPRLAGELRIALNSGAKEALDWRQIAEHPYEPVRTEAPLLTQVAVAT